MIVVDTNHAEDALFSSIRSAIFSSDSSDKDQYPTITRARLDLGDVELRQTTADDAPRLLIERKTWSDWCASISDGRYKEQKRRVLAASDHVSTVQFVYLLEHEEIKPWQGSSRGRPNKPLLCAEIKTQLRDGIHILKSRGTQDSGQIIAYIYSQFVKGELNTKPQKAQAPMSGVYKRKAACLETPSSQFVQMFSTVPGMSETKACALAEACGGLRRLAKMSEDDLANIMCGNRRLGPSLAQKLRALVRFDVEA